MALGDGIRRNIAHVSATERTRFKNAIVQLHSKYYPDGVSKWVKQDQIHEATHVHGGPSFLPWHRELCNRFEALLREIDPELSLHYWDWTEDPRAASDGNGGTVNLFTEDFMGESNGNVGNPFFGFPPISRDIAGGSAAPSNPGAQSDNDIINSTNGLPQAEQWEEIRDVIEQIPNHNSIHGYIGGTIGSGHTAFEDPFVFLLHSNVDRLWALWQTVPGEEWRLDPLVTYGNETSDPLLAENLEPWAGGSGLRPWAAPDNQQLVKNSKHPSVVAPPCYDTNLNMVPVVEVLNDGTPPVINFNDVPSGDTAARAAVFRIYGCGNATIQVQAGGDPAAPFSILQPISGSIVSPYNHLQYRDVRIWLGYTAGAANVAVPDSSVTFECVENGQSFTFIIKANAIVKPRTAVMLSLDQSGSMNDPAGSLGLKRIDVLKNAAGAFMELIPADSGVGLIRFDHDVYNVNDATYPGLPVTRINSNSVFDPDRVAALNAVSTHNPNPLGRTSVGDGVAMAKGILDGVPISDYEEKAMIVFTDGLENEPQAISDVTGSINDKTFAIGLGNETQVNTNALKTLTNTTGGYLLLSGLLSDSIDDYFRVSKYFLQILAGVTNNDIILDPNGFISIGMTVKIPFYISEADINATVVLLTDYPVVDIALETPSGEIIDAGNASGLGIDFEKGNRTRSYRFTLPVALNGANHQGKWIAHLSINREEYKRYLSLIRDQDITHQTHASTFEKHGAKYSLIINTYSNLKMKATLDQHSLEPGSKMVLGTSLTQYGIPLEHRAQVIAELTAPNGVMTPVELNEVSPGIFEKSVDANGTGTYVSRFVAKGITLRGNPFTREQTLTASVFPGGDIPTERPKDPVNPGKLPELMERCCKHITRILIAIGILIIILILLFLRR